MKRPKLTDKQLAFCREYVKNGYNATQAMISAGYKAASARVEGHRLLTNPNVKERIEHHKTHLEELLNISKSRIINEHKKLAFSSIAHLHNTWIERKDFDQLTDEERSTIAEIDTKIIKKVATEFKDGEFEAVPYEVEYVKIRLFDKQKALDSISKIMGYDAAQKVDLTTGGNVLPITEIVVKHSTIEDASTGGN